MSTMCKKCVSPVLLIFMMLLLTGAKCDDMLKLGARTIEENTCRTDINYFGNLPGWDSTSLKVYETTFNRLIVINDRVPFTVPTKECFYYLRQEGTGFDNLLNIDMDQVVLNTYENCRMTDDRKYMVPDNVIVIPVKHSDVQEFSELFEHWLNYTSTSSNSINARTSFPFIKISGSFSDEKESVKEHQVNDKSSTTRVQVRHHLYTARMDNPALHPTFKSRVLNIGANCRSNNTRMARYLTQLLVRDYGTHVVTSVDVGGIFLQRDHVKSSFVNDYSREKYQIKAAASASFWKGLAGGGGFNTYTSEEVLKYYLTNRTFSEYQTFGGKPFVNQTTKKWQDGLPNNLVAIDRHGDPLHYMITTNTLPNFPEPMVDEISKLIEEEVKRYYEVNTYTGCTKMKSPNFNFRANLDDGSCVAPYNNYTFGGVYQTCETQLGPNSEDFCSNLLQKNPLTGAFSCSAGYKAVQINTGEYTYTTSRQECNEHCKFLSFGCKKSCENVSFSIEVIYKTFWCAATGTVSQQYGYLFGGIFTSTMMNPWTETQGCPNAFLPLRMGLELFVCVSDDYELGYRYSIPFGGFFSCSAGNLLSLPSRREPINNLSEFFQEAGPATWPQRCPTGYSQHLAAIDNDCRINVCIKANALSHLGLPKVHRPPYSQKPGGSPNITEILYIVGPDSNILVKNMTSSTWHLMVDHQAEAFFQTDAESSDLKRSSCMLVASMATGIAIVVLIVIGSVILVKKVVEYRRQTRKVQDGRNDYAAIPQQQTVRT